MPRKQISLSHKEAREAVKKFGSSKRAAREIGVAETTFRRVLGDPSRTGGVTQWQEANKKNGNNHAKQKKRASVNRLSIEDIQASHDQDYMIPRAIEVGIDNIGEDAALYEHDFAKLAGVSITELSRYRDQFADYWAETKRGGKRRIWAGSSKMADEIRRRIS